MRDELDLFPPPTPIDFAADPAPDLPDGAEVVVVGAGMVGAMAAYRLAERGVRPLVIDANAPASGASGRLAGIALAGLGRHFPVATRLARAAGARSILDYTTRSLDLLEALDAELPGGIEWQRCGSLDLLVSGAEQVRGRELAALQAADGLAVSIIGPEELAEREPSVDTDLVRLARWTPRDGLVHPIRMVYALLDAARARGAQVVTGVRVDGLIRRAGRVAGVSTSAGEVSSEAVLLATNAWTPALVPHLGANLTPIREHVCVTEPLPPLLRHGFETNGCNEYWRQLRSGEILIGGFAAAEQGMGIGQYAMSVQPDVPPRLGRLLGEMHPAARDARIVRCWAGLLDFASLEVPMAGRLPEADGTPVPGGYVACGLTGHGLPYAPVLGLLLAELITGGEARTLSLAPFDPARYSGASHAPTWLDSFAGERLAT